MTHSRFNTHLPSALVFQAIDAGGLRGFCAKWRLRRQCEARARELETVLREMDPRLHRDIGFDLMACRRGEEGTANGYALIQAASIAFAEEPREGA
jgi:hypothetical protein